MNHFTYLNPKILDLPSSKYTAIHVNPNFRKNGNVYVNPLFINSGPIPQTSSTTSVPVATKSSRFTWRKKQDDQEQFKPKIVTKSGLQLIRKPISNFESVKTTKVHSKFKLDKRPYDVRRRSNIKKKSLYKLQNLFPKNVYSVNKQSEKKSR